MFHIAHDLHSESWDYLLDEHDQLAAVIGGGYEYGMGRFYGELVLDKVDDKTIGRHRVAWIQTTEKTEERTGTDEDMGFDITRRTHVTICLPGDASTPTRCPLRDVPIAETHEGSDTSTTKLGLTIDDDGTATLRLVAGPSDEQIAALVGPHKLW